jgi:hypothetical protein
MRRLYFLVPDVGCAKTIVNELLLARVEERHMHLVAKEGTPMEDLPEASFLQKTDFVPALEKGLAVGGATGALAGLAAITFPPAGLVFGGGAILAMALAGAGFGAWAASLIGASTPNSRIRDFEKAIEQGQILMMVDVPKQRVHDIEEAIKQHHPEAHVEGTEPTVPPFP